MSRHSPLRCATGDRRRVTGDPASGHNGIDYLEVVSEDQRTLEVHLLHPAPGEPGGVPAGPPLGAANVRIDGGERITGIKVSAVAVAGEVLTVTVDTAGDFSPYTLRLVAAGSDDAVPPGVDPALAAVGFSFKAGCPSRFDCRPDVECPPEDLPPTPLLDYTAKDHARLRQVLHDRIALHLRDWAPGSPADPLVAVTDLLAHVAEQLSVTTDLVGTEAHLHTARSRVSLRRHARLLDHHVHDGSNARVLVAFDVDGGSPADGALLDAHTPVVTRGHGGAAALTALPHPGSDATVFETLHPLRLASERNALTFHTYSDEECCLPAGATSAVFVRPTGLDLGEGDVLVLTETVGATTGLAADADPERRHPVRLVAATPGHDPVEGVDVVAVSWHAADALPFPLCVTARLSEGGAPEPVAVALGNVALADHGRTVEGVGLRPDIVDPAVQRGRPWRPEVLLDDLTVAAAYDHDGAVALPVAEALDPDVRGALPAITLHDGTLEWQPARDLLQADGAAARFVVEFERGASAAGLGRPRLRVGDGRSGRRPPDGTRFVVTARRGGGATGNVGAEAIGHVVTALDGIRRVRNPLGAVGGAAPESFAAVRRSAPEGFRVQRRAVTPADYVAVAEEHPDVQRAAAHVRWTGSWHTVFVTVDRRGGRTVTSDPVFRTDLLARLDRRRLAGAHVQLRDPVPVPVDLTLWVCVAPDIVRADVEAEIRRLLSARTLPDGRRGWFHPDRWTFGEPLHLSPVLALVQDVDGVVAADATAFHRFGRAAAGELADGVLRVGPVEVVQLEDDPNFPERGRLTLDVEGGR